MEYTIEVPSQGENTFSSFLMYLNTQDVGVNITDVVITVKGEPVVEGSVPEGGTGGCVYTFPSAACGFN